MKAIVCTKYGPPDVLQLKEIDKPVPGKNEACIKIFATSVTASDCIVRGFKLPIWHPIGLLMGLVLGFNKPRNSILGMVLAGEVESVGKDVKSFKKGAQVFAWTLKSPVQIRFGTSAVQLAKYFGAEVTGVCSTTNLELVRSLGTDTVIDYTKEDITNRGELYDFILDAVGKSKSSKLKLQCQNALTPNGKYISVDDGSPKANVENLILLKELVETGELNPVIDRNYPLEQIVEAHRYVDKGHKKGNVVITVEHNDKM